MYHFSNFEYKQKTQAFGLGFEYLNDKEIQSIPSQRLYTQSNEGIPFA